MEDEIRNYYSSCKAIEQLKRDITSDSSDSLVKYESSIFVLCKRLERLERTTEAIRTIYNESLPEHQELIRMVFWENINNIDYIATQLNMGTKTVYRMKRIIVERIGERLGHE